MKGLILIGVFLLIRFAYPYYLNPKALARLQAFAPMDKGKGAYIVYQLTNIILIISPLFLSLSFRLILGILGLISYILGLWILILALRAFSQSKDKDFAQEGLYKYSRHPIYVAYFFIFLSIGLLARSWAYLVILAIFQIAGHIIVLAEETWCLKTYGQAYKTYMSRVPRYF